MSGVAGDPMTAGGVSADEVAAALAALTQRSPSPPTSRYERWRRTRLAALRGHGSDR